MMTARRPTVLLADDHPGVLQSVARVLNARFDVVAAVGDGRAALAAAADLDPDFAVFDISMPVMDGLQAAAALARRGARTKVVLLTMHDDDEFVRSALAGGASAFVLKSRIGSDLFKALDRVGDGGTFVSPRRHQVHIYSTDDDFLDAAARFVALPLAAGDPVVAVLTAAHHDALAARLALFGTDLARARARGQYTAFDVDDVIRTVLADGPFDAKRFVSLAESTVASLEARTLRRVCFVGEGVSRLCEMGNPEAALEVERLWNAMSVGHSLQALCAYSGAGLTARLVAEICAEHSAVGGGAYGLH
jgi:CheY-like chemotaxis protein